MLLQFIQIALSGKNALLACCILFLIIVSVDLLFRSSEKRKRTFPWISRLTSPTQWHPFTKQGIAMLDSPCNPGLYMDLDG